MTVFVDSDRDRRGPERALGLPFFDGDRVLHGWRHLTRWLTAG